MTLDEFFTRHAPQLRNRAKCVIKHVGNKKNPQRFQKDGNELFQVIQKERIPGTNQFAVAEAYIESGWVEVSAPPAGAKKAKDAPVAPLGAETDEPGMGVAGEDDPGDGDGEDAPAEDDAAAGSGEDDVLEEKPAKKRPTTRKK